MCGNRLRRIAERAQITMSSRKITARLLLSVYLPVMLFAYTHVHKASISSASISCEYCKNHIHHGGHLENSNDEVEYCLLCLFNDTSCIGSDECEVDVIEDYIMLAEEEVVEPTLTEVYQSSSPRAPPVA